MNPSPNTGNYFKGGAVVMLQKTGESYWRHLGNLPTFSFETALDMLEHETSQYGTRIIDKRVATQKNIRYELTMDEFGSDQLELIFAGTASVYTQAVAAGSSVTLNAPVSVGRWYDLGKYKVDVTGATYGAGATALAADEFEVREDLGMFRCTKADLDAADDVTISFDVPAISGTQIALLQNDPAASYKAKITALNDAGKLLVWTPPSVLATFSGKVDIALRDWSKIPAMLEILPDFEQTNPYGSLLVL